MATHAEAAPGFAAARGGGLAPAIAIARRAFADSKIRTIGFAYLFAAIAYIQPVGYRDAYPKLSDRIAFAHSFGGNSAVRLFYGTPYDLLTIGGYTAWRVGGTLVIFAAAWGTLAAVRAMRTEEDAGRAELMLAGIIGRQTAFAAALVAIGASMLILWLACLAGLLLGGLAAGDSAFLALSVASVLPVFVGVGALASQLAPTRRIALELGGAVVAVAFALRVIADTSSGAEWLRWSTPLGWAEEMQPFHHARPLVLLLPLAASALLLTVASAVAAHRDLGSAVLGSRDSAEPQLRLLSSPTALALRSERLGVSVWLLSVGAFAYIMGVVSKSVSSAGISENLQKAFAKLGTGSIATARGYIAFAFIFFFLAASLFMCAQIGAARHEEAEQQLETELALPVSRRAWLGGRLALALAGATLISLAAGFFTWAGAASSGVADLSLPKMLEAGANCLPIAILFLGLAALAYALVPRASAGIAYGLVIASFLWQLFGSLLGVPKWLVDATPFAHVGMIPIQPFRLPAAVVMVAIGALAAAAAVARFERRDLLGA